MISENMLEILVCPETRQRVSSAPEALVRSLNEKIVAGGIANRAGTMVMEPVDGLLVREDGRYAYVVRNDIPVMLIDEALPL